MRITLTWRLLRKIRHRKSFLPSPCCLKVGHKFLMWWCPSLSPERYPPLITGKGEPLLLPKMERRPKMHLHKQALLNNCYLSSCIFKSLSKNLSSLRTPNLFSLSIIYYPLLKCFFFFLKSPSLISSLGYCFFSGNHCAHKNINTKKNWCAFSPVNPSSV